MNLKLIFFTEIFNIFTEGFGCNILYTTITKPILKISGYILFEVLGFFFVTTLDYSILWLGDIQATTIQASKKSGLNVHDLSGQYFHFLCTVWCKKIRGGI